MAETPLFVPNNETVANLVGLKNLRGGGSSQFLLEESIRAAKATLWMQLGLSLITTLQGTTYVASPSDDEEFVRLIARQVEIDTIRWHLMDVMQLGFKGGEAEFIESWNTDGKFKRLSTNQLDNVRAKLWDYIAVRIQILKGEVAGGEMSSARAFSISADEAGYDTVALHRYSPYTGDILDGLLEA